jgi:4-hydroxy-tetrahydrodipicolinate reductase
MPLALAILGATGKMGKSLLSAIANDPDLSVVAEVARPHSQSEHSLQTALTLCDVAVDFSVQEAVIRHVQAALGAKKPIVIGTTGLLSEDWHVIEKAAHQIPIVHSANFSFGISLCLDIAANLANALFGISTIDIFETHHIHKKDQPSGTALSLACAIGKGKIITDTTSHPRHPEEVAIHSIRSGETIGEHHLVFECGHERIEIKHSVHSRETFAQGALRAAKILAHKSAGLYALKDLFSHE